MEGLPTAIADRLREQVGESALVAFLGVDERGRLVAWGGQLERYGIDGLEHGRRAAEVAVFLEGLLPLGGEAVEFRLVQLLPDRYVDVHLLPGDSGAWVVLLDSTADAEARQLVQQQGNERALARDGRRGRPRRPRRTAAPQREDGPPPARGGTGGAIMTTLHAHVVDVLGIAILRHTHGTRFVVETAPHWLQSLVEGLSVGDIVDVVERFPFLESFLPDAEGLWADAIPGVETSDIWVEQRSAEVEIPLQALATRSVSECLLLLRIPWEEYEEKRELMTRARSARLEHDRLRKEIQKKEILLHCIVHDLANPLSGIVGALAMIERGQPEPKLQEYVKLCRRLCDDQLRLIRSILDAFAAELGPAGPDALADGDAADARKILNTVRDKLLPAFSVNDVELLCRHALKPAEEARVVIDAVSLERVVLNLVENALRHSPRGSTVTMGVERDGGELTLWVDDQGPGVPAELKDRLFEKFSQGRGGRGKVGLGLYFCRITAERWNGSVGHQDLPGGGSRFWIRLPAYRPVPASSNRAPTAAPSG